jgi:hypothetical protein
MKQTTGFPKNKFSLTHLYDISWREVMAIWRVGEASQAAWKEHWEERGYDSWEEWRTAYAQPLAPQDIQWKVYELKDPKDLGQLYGTPTRGWIEKCYRGEKTRKLKDELVQSFVKDNQKVGAIKENPPYQTMITGIIHDGAVILIEGMHRALAIHDLARQEKYHGNIMIALGDYEGDEVPILGKGDQNKDM